MIAPALPILGKPEPETAATPKASKADKTLNYFLKRVAVFKKDHFHCVYCGQNLLADSNYLLTATIDHITPLAAGGPNTLPNKATCCWSCNRFKGSSEFTSIEEGRRLIARRKQEELAKFREALGEITPPPSAELAGMTEAAETLDVRTLAGQAVLFAETCREHERLIRLMARAIKERADAADGFRGVGPDQSATKTQPTPPRPWWRTAARRVRESLGRLATAARLNAAGRPRHAALEATGVPQ